MKMTTLQNLIASRNAIASPDNWTRFSRRSINRLGQPSYCALGAVDVGAKTNAENAPETEVLYQCLLPAEKERGLNALQNLFRTTKRGVYPHCSVVAQFNNASEHHEVLALFDRAVERQRMIDEMQEPVTVSAEKELAG
jgi:hypothetical protein